MKPLILSLVVAVIATTIGAGWAISLFHSKLYDNSSEVDRSLFAYQQLGQSVASTLDNFDHQADFIEHWQEQSRIDINLIDLVDFPLPTNMADDFKDGKPLLLESDGEMSMHIYMRSSDQVMAMVLPVQNANAGQSWLNILLTLLFYFVVIVVLLAWLYPLIKRLISLQRTTKKLGRGDLSSRIEPSPFSYIGEIESEFNRMAAQIQNLVDDNQLLSRAVSHNLKTPITRLRMGVDVLEEETDRSAMDSYIVRINRDLDEMQSLVETLLQYSSLDEFNLNLQTKNIDLNQYIPKLVDAIDAPGVLISTRLPGHSLVLSTDPRYLSMQINNLLSNAVQYADSQVLVTVEAINDAGQSSKIVITVEDDGDGIPEAERGNVIKPFWRGEHSGSARGHGMGLAIVSRIADWLKAELLIARSSSLGGASIELSFSEHQ